MAPIKLEDNIREKLQERELQPSPQSWEKLATQLGTPAKNKRRSVWWMAAASIAAIVIIGSVVFSNANRVAEDAFVETEDLQVNEETNLASEDLISEDIADETIEANSIIGEEELAVQDVIVQDAPKKDVVRKESVQKEVISSEIPEVATQEAIAKAEEVKTAPNSFEDMKVGEVVSSVQELMAQNGSVTAAEVDALLLNAQREIQNKRLLKGGTAKIDPAALLEDVEWELERSFRDKVFEALGDGYQKIRTAMVERNN